MSSRRTWVLILTGLVVAVATSLWLGRSEQTYPGRLDPQNPEPDGARALARVLADQGVEVEVVRSADAFDAADLGSATVLVTSADQLGESTARRLTRRVAGGSAGQRVPTVPTAPAVPTIVVEPSGALAAALGVEARPERVPAEDELPARCADPRLADLRVAVETPWSYPAPPGGSGCFPVGGDDRVLWAPRGSLTFLGFGDALTNGGITAADNAAAALRLLGGSARLVWYVPDLADLRAGDEIGLASLLPRWLGPALWLVGLVLAALVVWRGRRLGPLATEPLPVAVRAIESTTSRARLYRRAHDRAHAAEALRSAARARAAERLRLPRQLTEDALLREVASHTGRDLGSVAALLASGAPAPATDRDLTDLATGLAALHDTLRKASR